MVASNSMYISIKERSMATDIWNFPEYSLTTLYETSVAAANLQYA
jgi:hypothetical protein